MFHPAPIYSSKQRNYNIEKSKREQAPIAKTLENRAFEGDVDNVDNVDINIKCFELGILGALFDKNIHKS